MPIVEPAERSVKGGTRLGPYEIVSRIGAGGMGEVWRARDTRLDRDVAIKILPDEFAADEKLKMRFEREAKTPRKMTEVCRALAIATGCAG